MRTNSILISLPFIPFMFACQPDDNTTLLYHEPAGEVTVKIYDTTLILGFRLDERMYSAISSEFGENEINKIKTREDLISYYPTLYPSFQPGYSSMSDKNEYIFTKTEYLLAQECVHNDCSSQTRKGILKIAIGNQKKKFGVAYTSPSFTRRTGAFLIAVILVKERDESFIQSLKNDVDLQKTLLCLGTDIWIDEEVNNKLIHSAEIFLSN